MKKIATVFTAILLAAAMLLPQAMLADQGAVFTMNGTDNVPAGGTFDGYAERKQENMQSTLLTFPLNMIPILSNLSGLKSSML